MAPAFAAHDFSGLKKATDPQRGRMPNHAMRIICMTVRLVRETVCQGPFNSS
jgi:hypothetical protein